jgi:YD repeat-containing protein
MLGQLRRQYPGALYHVMSRGNRHLHTHELGLVTTNTWDALNRLVSTAFPDGTTISNRYDILDVVGVKDRLGRRTYSGFNSVRQLTAVTTAGSQVTPIDYCGCGSPATISRASGKTDPDKLGVGARAGLGTRKTANANLHRYLKPSAARRGGQARRGGGRP